MARFYARFDSGSTNGVNWGTELIGTTGTKCFDRRRIGTDAAHGDRLRTGLIDSRSLVSSDALADIPVSYQDGQGGTIIPRDLYSTDNSTYAAWSNIYKADASTATTSYPGPWGVIIPANFRSRPTGSILSTNTLIGNPAGTAVNINYTNYLKASTAVKDVLNLVQTGAGTLTTPFNRSGTNQDRTMHSIWHDPDLQYFAWDDFTPGTPPTPTVEVEGGGAPNTITLKVALTPSTFLNDVNPDAIFDMYLSVDPPTGCTGGTNGTGQATLDLRYGSAELNGTAIYYGTSTGSAGTPITGPANLSGGGNSSWYWDASNKQLKWNISVGAFNYKYSGFINYHDVTIPAHISYSETYYINCFPDGL